MNDHKGVIIAAVITGVFSLVAAIIVVAFPGLRNNDGNARPSGEVASAPSKTAERIDPTASVASGGLTLATATPTAPATVAPRPTPTLTAGAISLTATICPAGYGGDDFAGDCTTPAQRTTISLVGVSEATGRTDDQGRLRFSGLGPDTYELYAKVRGDAAGSWAFCADPAGREVAGDLARNGVTVQVAAGVMVICNWYIVPD